MTTRRAPPGARLDAIEAAFSEDIAEGIEVCKIDSHLVLALVRFALTHGASTVGDLDLTIREQPAPAPA